MTFRHMSLCPYRGVKNPHRGVEGFRRLKTPPRGELQKNFFARCARNIYLTPTSFELPWSNFLYKKPALLNMEMILAMNMLNENLNNDLPKKDIHVVLNLLLPSLAFQNLRKCIQIALTIPVTSASCA